MPAKNCGTNAAVGSGYRGSTSRTSWPSSVSRAAVSRTACTCTGSGRTPRATGLVLQPIRSRPGSRPTASTNGSWPPAVYRSPSTLPRIASYTSALSSTLRVSGPAVPSAHHRGGGGAVVTRPRCGLKPNSPQPALGSRIEPPPAPPMPTRPQPGGAGARRTAAGAAGRAAGVPVVAGDAARGGLGERERPELRHRGLADDHRAGDAEPAYDLGVRGGRRGV